jgi:hypothetical protein
MAVVRLTTPSEQAYIDIEEDEPFHWTIFHREILIVHGYGLDRLIAGASMAAYTCALCDDDETAEQMAYLAAVWRSRQGLDESM